MEALIEDGHTPVAVEFSPEAERLPDFVHPEQAVYVFGPEDGGLTKGDLSRCHRFVTVPSRTALNLAACVNLVLYDRTAKAAGLLVEAGGGRATF